MEFQQLHRHQAGRPLNRRAVLLLAGLLAATPVAAQQAGAASPAFPADSADVSSPDAIIKALYDVISGGIGEKRNWDRFRSLFAPGARLIPAAAPAVRQDGSRLRPLTPDEYIQRVDAPFLRDGFFEIEVARRTDAYGTIYHAFSTYESRRRPDDPKPFARGINSIQLLKDANRWWVVSIFWDQEGETNPLPPKYLPGGGTP